MCNWLPQILRSNEPEKKAPKWTEEDELEYSRKRRAKITQEIIDWKAANPLKYKPKDEFFHWVVVKGRQYIYQYAACGYNDNIGEMSNKYTIVNFNTGDIKEVDESFLDDLKNAGE